MAEGGPTGGPAPGYRGGLADRLIGIAAPLLDVVLAVGDRISRIAEPTDHEYYPIRPASERQLPEPVAAGDVEND